MRFLTLKVSSAGMFSARHPYSVLYPLHHFLLWSLFCILVLIHLYCPYWVMLEIHQVTFF